jgi:hypothetical protein
MSFMSNQHIIDLLDNSAVTRLSQGELFEIEAHARDCDMCCRALEAARASAAMLEARAAETLEPQPFFKTRVMAAIRESRAEQPAFLRLWRSAGALFAAMLMVVVLLSTLSLFTNPQQDEPFESNIARSEIYPENIVFDDEGAADDEPLSYAQVLDLVFDSEDSDGE